MKQREWCTQRRVVLALLGAIVALSGCEKYRLDRQMAELCKKDGGVRVYETVTLSSAEYEALFKYKVVAKTREEYYGRMYRYVSSRTYVVGREGNAERGRGELLRHYEAIYRSSDSVLLGESIWYSRVGADLILLGMQPSGDSCPKQGIGLATTIFRKGN